MFDGGQGPEDVSPKEALKYKENGDGGNWTIYALLQWGRQGAA